jgi:mannose-6-phosphate isomerase
MESNQTEKHKPVDGPSILIVTRGNGKLTGDVLKTEQSYDLQEGYVYFVGANTPISAESGEAGLEFYRAYSVPPTQQ